MSPGWGRRARAVRAHASSILRREITRHRRWSRTARPVHSSSRTATTWWASTESPTATRTSATTPSSSALIRCSIFIASRITRVSPAATWSPGSTRTAVTVPGTGVTRPWSWPWSEASGWRGRTRRTVVRPSPVTRTQSPARRTVNQPPTPSTSTITRLPSARVRSTRRCAGSGGRPTTNVDSPPRPAALVEECRLSGRAQGLGPRVRGAGSSPVATPSPARTTSTPTVAVAGVVHLDRQVGAELGVAEPAHLRHRLDVAPAGRRQRRPRLAHALLLGQAERGGRQVQRQLPALEDGRGGLRVLVEECRGRVPGQERPASAGSPPATPGWSAHRPPAAPRGWSPGWRRPAPGWVRGR